MSSVIKKKDHKAVTKVQHLSVRKGHFMCYQSLPMVGTKLDGLVEVPQKEREVMLRQCIAGLVAEASAGVCECAAPADQPQRGLHGAPDQAGGEPPWHQDRPGETPHHSFNPRIACHICKSNLLLQAEVRTRVLRYCLPLFTTSIACKGSASQRIAGINLQLALHI